MLSLKLADAYVDLTLDARRFYSGMVRVQATLARLPAMHMVTINVNRASAAASISLLMQQLRAAQALTRFNLTATRGGGFGMGGARAGMGGGGFVAGVGQGLGLPFATSPQMMIGQAVGSAVGNSVATAAGLQTQIAELRRVTGMQADVAAAFKQSLFSAGTLQAGVSVQDLMEISQIGGRAGVSDREGPAGLLTFTKDLAMVKNAVADMPTEELASSMLKVLNVFELGTDRVAGFGSALTAMDNVSVASARDILNITSRLSGTAQAIGLTLPQVLAFSGVLKDVGLSNEVAGTSFSQIFRLMGSKSEQFAAKIGVDAKTFADAYRRDPMEALGMVIERFKEMSDTIEGQEFLSGLGFKGARVAGSLQQLATKFDEVARRAKVASAETGSLNALISANALKSDTLEASWVKLKNALTALSDAMGAPFLKPATDATNAMTALVKSLGQGDTSILLKTLSLSMGPTMGDDMGKFAARQTETRRQLEDWIMVNVLGQKPGAPPIAGGGGNALPANKPQMVGPPNLNRDPNAVQNLLFQGQARLGNALFAMGEMRQGLLGAGAKGLGMLPGMGVEREQPRFLSGMSGEDVGRRLQEDILNMGNRLAEETAKNTGAAKGLLGEIRDILRQGAGNVQAAVLGQ